MIFVSFYFSGFIRDNFGVYDVAYYIAAGVSVFITFNSAIVTCIIQKRRRKEVLYNTLK